MRFSLSREVLLKPLQQVVNVVERRQTLPVLANLLVAVDGQRLSMTGTDLEVEMVARADVEDGQTGETTIPARKLFEIVRALPVCAELKGPQEPLLRRSHQCRRSGITKDRTAGAIMRIDVLRVRFAAEQKYGLGHSGLHEGSSQR